MAAQSQASVLLPFADDQTMLQGHLYSRSRMHRQQTISAECTANRHQLQKLILVSMPIICKTYPTVHLVKSFQFGSAMCITHGQISVNVRLPWLPCWKTKMGWNALDNILTILWDTSPPTLHNLSVLLRSHLTAYLSGWQVRNLAFCTFQIFSKIPP